MANPFKVRKASDNSNDGFSETLNFYVMHQSNVSSNHNKHYCLELQKHPDGRYRIFTHYGRLGISNVYEVRETYEGKPIYDEAIARKEFESIHKKKLRGKSVKDKETGEKVREAYVDVETVAPTVGSENIRGNSEVKKTASVKVNKATIDTSDYDPAVAKLVDQLIDENVHNITSNTSIKYTTNGFATELGPVTPEHVDRAKQPLDELNKLMGKKGEVKPSREVRDINSAFFSLIPKPFSRKITEDDMILDAQTLQAEYDILDQLATGVQMGSAMSGNAAQKMNALGTEIEVVKDRKTLDRIKRYVNTTRANNHRHMDVYGYKVRRVFKVKLPEERSRYKKVEKQLGNVKEVFHGSASSNCLSILKGGLIIPPTRAGHVTGRLNGDAIYGAIQSTKAMNYCTGFWGGNTSNYNNIFLFLVDFAMGKTYETTSSTPNGAPRGYDSVWAKPGYLYNHELMVYRVEQATITYIIELTR